MIEGFEIGKYYRWIGPNPENTDRDLKNWNREGGMDYVLDGKILKCIVVLSNTTYALFKGMTPFPERDGCWSWEGNLHNFEEVKFIEEKQYLLEFDNG